VPECFLTSAVFELVQQFYHATEIGNAANVDKTADKINTIVLDKINYRGTQS